MREFPTVWGSGPATRWDTLRWILCTGEKYLYVHVTTCNMYLYLHVTTCVPTKLASLDCQYSIVNKYTHIKKYAYAFWH